MSAASAKSGLTLIEIIIALVLFSTGIIAITRGFSVGLAASGDSENTATALNIAQKALETVKNTPYANITSSGPSADPVFANFNTTVSAATGQNPMQVNVTVAWIGKGGNANVTLTTLVANY